MTDIDTTIQAYFDMWNEQDPGRRAQAIERAWTGEAHYVDPMFQAEGPAALSEMVAGVHQQFPGHRFRLAGGIDEHHGYVRYQWELTGPDGAVAAAGLDVGRVAEDGRLKAVVGFLN
jgi:SnoaL-like domain